MIYVWIITYLAIGLGVTDMARRLCEERILRDPLDFLLVTMLWPFLVVLVLVALFFEWIDRIRYGKLSNDPSSEPADECHD